METPDAMSKLPRRAWPVRDAKSLGRALRDYRVAAGLTQVQLSSMIGVDRPYLSELEGGKETEQLRRLFAAFKALDLKLYLQKESGEPD
jgi:transcriptional regulator with XRE-family HTH domain